LTLGIAIRPNFVIFYQSSEWETRKLPMYRWNSLFWSHHFKLYVGTSNVVILPKKISALTTFTTCSCHGKFGHWQAPQSWKLSTFERAFRSSTLLLSSVSGTAKGVL